jgi:hypothetical protein
MNTAVSASDQADADNFDEILEKFITGADIAGLSPKQRVVLYYRFCERLGVDPESGALQYLRLQGRLTFYVTAKAVDQICDKRLISRKPADARFLREDIYQVVAEARDQRGRYEQRTSYILLRDREGRLLQGDALFNAFKRCETAACRRAGVAMSGLGAMSEDDADAIAGAQKVSVAEVHGTTQGQTAPTKGNSDAVVDTSTGEVLDRDGQIRLWKRIDRAQQALLALDPEAHIKARPTTDAERAQFWREAPAYLTELEDAAARLTQAAAPVENGVAEDDEGSPI